MNERFEQLAQSYAALIKEIKDAERKLSRARDERDVLAKKANNCVLGMREFVGSNISRKAVVVPGGIVVTIEYVSENCIPAIHVYENGEEIS